MESSTSTGCSESLRESSLLRGADNPSTDDVCSLNREKDMTEVTIQDLSVCNGCYWFRRNRINVGLHTSAQILSLRQCSVYSDGCGPQRES